jgi:hypothetical protein
VLFDPNATVTIGRVETDVTPRAPSLNTPSEYAILPDDPDAAEPTWTTRAQVRDVASNRVDALRLSPNLGEASAGQTYSIFLDAEAKVPAWVKPSQNVYVKFDNGAVISGILKVRIGMTSFAIKNGLSTPYFVTERGAR